MKHLARRAAVLSALALVTTGVAACGSSDKKTDATTTSAEKGVVNVELTSDGCKASPSTVKAGPTTFKVKNTDAAGVSEVELLQGERIVGEKENLAPGFSGAFSLRIDGGTYRLYCPGATSEYTTFKVTGKAASTTGSTSDLLAEGTKTYGTYIHAQSLLLVQNVEPLVTAIKDKDLAQAQKAYAQARPYYERVEPVAESFKNLDPAIDARAGDVPAKDWTGFHPIEKGLFQTKSFAGLTPLANGLLKNSKRLAKLTDGLTYQPAELLNGAGSLLDEVSTSKITGEEERYSHIDMLDFQANVEGAEQAFANVQDGLKKIDPALTSTIAGRFSAVDNLLDHYRDGSALGGFVRYGKLTVADKRKLANAVNTLKQPLSDAGSKVASAG